MGVVCGHCTRAQKHLRTLSKATTFVPKDRKRGRKSCRGSVAMLPKFFLLLRSASYCRIGASLRVMGCWGYACATTIPSQMQQHGCKIQKIGEEIERGSCL